MTERGSVYTGRDSTLAKQIWRRPGQAKCKWDSSPTMHDLPSQCKSEGSPGHGQTGEGNFGEGLVRLSVNRVIVCKKLIPIRGIQSC